jgi:hypothetical protein
MNSFFSLTSPWSGGRNWISIRGWVIDPCLTVLKQQRLNEYLPHASELYAGMAKVAQRFAHSLYMRWTGQIFDTSFPRKVPPPNYFENVGAIAQLFNGGYSKRQAYNEFERGTESNGFSS